MSSETCTRREEFMSDAHPTPLLMARRGATGSLTAPPLGNVLVDERRREDLLDLLATVALIGPTSEDDSTPRLKEAVNAEINPFIHDRVSPEALVDVWTSILDGKIVATTTDLLFIEFWASIGYPQVRAALSRGVKRFKYTQTLFAIRKRVAFAMYDYAREMNWRQPVAFVSALKVARAYLRDAAGHDGFGSQKDYGQFTGKLGVATILIAGFEAIAEDEANEAFEALQASLDHGNDPVSALPYLLGAATLRFDFSGNVDDLSEAVEFSQKFGDASRSIPLRLAVAQAQLRIAIRTTDPRLLDHVASIVADVDEDIPHRVTDFLTTKILKGVSQHLRTQGFTGLTATQLRVPFGYRTGDETHPLLIASAREVFVEIATSGRLHDVMVADVMADLIVNCRAGLKIDYAQALASAVKYRRAIRGRRDQDLVRAQNELELASLNRDPAARLRAAQSLAVISTDARYTAAAQMALAHNVESWGALVSSGAELASAPADGTDLVSLAINGTARDLWLLAARSAFGNANLVKKGLGGRSSVTTVGDYYGLVTETLVFKRMDKANYLRGAARSAEIQRFLDEAGESTELGVPVILDAMETLDTVVVAHRFVAGTSLAELVEAAEAAERVQLATRAARFLGKIHKIEEKNATADGVRASLKSKEVGRFLKTCGVEDYLASFECWWDAVARVDKVTRKDAHLDNWLLGQDGRLYALDWEAAGCRPVGYELAQITDDHAHFPVEAWDTRRTVFDAYVAEIAPVASVEECWLAYKAGVLARHLWAITSPERAKHFRPGEGESRLQAYAQSVDDDELAAVARTALNAILAKRGLRDLPPATKNTTGAGRVRVSKKIAYLLRHRLDLERDEDGWVRTALIAHELGDVSDQEVATVATDPREARFEINGALIRARYGHSAKLNQTVNFEDSIPPETHLYHASPWSFATEVLDQQQGLQAKNRGMVHLTDSFGEAVASGVRGGHPLVYETEASRLSQATRAGVLTYLTPDVRASQLRVVPMASYWRLVPALKNSIT